MEGVCEKETERRKGATPFPHATHKCSGRFPCQCHVRTASFSTRCTGNLLTQEDKKSRKVSPQKISGQQETGNPGAELQTLVYYLIVFNNYEPQILESEM